MTHLPISILPQGKLVQLDLWEEVAPGVKTTVKLPRHVVPPRQGIVRLVPTDHGLLRPEIETHPGTVNLKDWKKSVFGVSRETVATLILAGFVDGEKPAPRTTLVVLESWFAHRERTRENPFFWADSDHLSRFTQAARILYRNHHRHEKQGAGSREQGELQSGRTAEPQNDGPAPLPPAPCPLPPETASDASSLPPAVPTPAAPENAPPHHGGRRGKGAKGKAGKLKR